MIQMGFQKWQPYLICNISKNVPCRPPTRGEYLPGAVAAGSETHCHAWAQAMLPMDFSHSMAGHSRDSKAGPLVENMGLLWWLTDSRDPQRVWNRCKTTQKSRILLSTFPTPPLHLEAELHERQMAMLVLANSLPVFFLTSVPLIKPSHG